MKRESAVDAAGFRHKWREMARGTGANPDTMTCTCGVVVEVTTLAPEFEEHLAEVEARDAYRSIDEARRKLARGNGATTREGA